MTLVAITHGYPPEWSMGGEVSLHRTLVAAGAPVTVLTRTKKPYDLDGVHVERIATEDVLNINADPRPIAKQLSELGATTVIAQNELSLPAVRAARSLGIPSIVSIHTPPRYGRALVQSVREADAAIYNTATSAAQWQEPDALVLHPPISDLPPKPKRLPTGDAYTVLSSLVNKGVLTVLELAEQMPNQRFIIVRSPAEPTHGIPDLEQRAATLPNVELGTRVEPGEVYETYLSQTRILLVPSRYETYGMSTIEAAGYGIPTVHIDTPHVREGIGEAAYLASPCGVDATKTGIDTIEANYGAWSRGARAQAEAIAARQAQELDAWANWWPKVTPSNATQRNLRARIRPRRG